MFTHIMLYAINKVSVKVKAALLCLIYSIYESTIIIIDLFLLKVALYMYIHTLDHVIIILY